ncbi:GDSL esterase/lipase EXL3-like [Canna indica]|uniref:GDSL esterase/lipase EXL3-like n=1 Tax=Canna indica TaxID=4628 RepID=A0AAQ3KH61_9LILI|nr:GDSL esterase/lipase EXL3-like [Canna indica]
MFSFYLPSSSSRVAAASLGLFILLLLPITPQSSYLNRTAAVPAVIAFGDSIIDPGNNNAITTVVRCDFPPYGEDFAGHFPSGRFSNGKIPTDFIASKLGVKEFLPAYLGTQLRPEDLLTGVSFASGGSGFDPLTPKIVSVLSMADQMDLFKEYRERVRGVAGEERASSIFSDSLYVVCAGSDDLANNYFLLPHVRMKTYDFPAYANFLARSASSFVE